MSGDGITTGRVLFVMPQVPWPATQGTALRNFHLMKAIADAGFGVDLIAFGDTTLSIPVEIAALCRVIEIVPVPMRSLVARLRTFLAGEPDLAWRLSSPEFSSRLDSMLRGREYDVVQIEGFEMAGFLLGPGALRREAWDRAPWTLVGHRAPRIVFDDHNAEYQLQASASRVDSQRPRRWLRAIYSWVQASRIRRREALYASAADACLAVSEEDAGLLREVAPGVSVEVIANGIDVPSYRASASPTVPPTVFFAGKLDYRPNVDACEWLVRSVVPIVRASVPEVRVVLAGRDPSPAVRTLAGPGVEVTGYLTDAEMRARLAGATVAVVPIRMGSGTRFKVLEAMAAGVPVVATPFGAAGSGIVDGVHGLLSEAASDLGASVVRLLRDASLRESMAVRARLLAEARHDWSAITPRLIDVYRHLLSDLRPTSSVIATVRNEARTVGAVISGVARQQPPPSEMVIVDGGSDDDTVRVIREYSSRQDVIASGLRVSVRSEPGANISRGRNLAVGSAVGGVIAAVDAGTVLASDWFSRLVAPFDWDAGVGVVSGFFVGAPETDWERALAATTLPLVEDIDPVRFLPSSRSVAFRRTEFARAGGYPEWLDYGEDLVFDLAMRRLGVVFRFQPRAVVRFRPRPSATAFFLQYYRYARGDGKAGLFALRHAIRYGAYLGGMVLAVGASDRRLGVLPGTLLLAGAIGYLRRPLLRLAITATSPGDFMRCAPLLPLVRVVGDVAKMVGYPVGLWWRYSRGLPTHDLRPTTGRTTE